ncbi:NifB/NifX family molybdenum-iron cluster-binding protein [Aeromonas dhakensis]|uniref:NifB/NifX family molybdenum-iron cluster-binding protein n=1 Tax=Aeromonas dhakensis TaxID=196024 RepID=UPI002B4629A1|nr:NifB/NifX family molybdenum-iron cluster-binding protein [Aeromonas dhakensis]
MNQNVNTTAVPGNHAILLSRGRPSAHVSRAEQLQIVSPAGEVLATMSNPANGEGCRGKQALLATLQAHVVTQVLVRNIGEHMLGRLLDAGISVWQYRSAHLDLSAAHFQPLTDASQGSPSRRKASKASKASKAGNLVKGIRPSCNGRKGEQIGRESGCHQAEQCGCNHQQGDEPCHTCC